MCHARKGWRRRARFLCCNPPPNFPCPTRRRATLSTATMHSRGVVLLLACVPASAALQLPRLRPLPRRLEAIVLDADGSFLDPDHKVSPANAEVTLAPARFGARA